MVFDPEKDTGPLYANSRAWGAADPSEYLHDTDDADTAAIELLEQCRETFQREIVPASLEHLLEGADYKKGVSYNCVWEWAQNVDVTTQLDLVMPPPLPGTICILDTLFERDVQSNYDRGLVLSVFIMSPSGVPRSTCYNKRWNLSQGADSKEKDCVMVYPPYMVRTEERELYTPTHQLHEKLRMHSANGILPNDEQRRMGITPSSQAGHILMRVEPSAPLWPFILSFRDMFQERYGWNMDDPRNIWTDAGSGQVVSYMVPSIIVAEVVRFVHTMSGEVNYFCGPNDQLLFRLERRDGKPFTEGMKEGANASFHINLDVGVINMSMLDQN